MNLVFALLFYIFLITSNAQENYAEDSIKNNNLIAENPENVKNLKKSGLVDFKGMLDSLHKIRVKMLADTEEVLDGRKKAWKEYSDKVWNNAYNRKFFGIFDRNE